MMARLLIGVAAFGLLVTSCTTSATDVTSSSTGPTTTTTIGPGATTAITTTTIPTTSTTPSGPVFVAGWDVLPVDPDMFGAVSITDAATDGSRVVVAGCEWLDRGSPGTPIWWSDDTVTWNQVDVSEDAVCITQIERTRFGWLAVGGSTPVWSDDGAEWQALELDRVLGYEFPGQLGRAQAIFVSPDGDRVTLLFSRAAEAESTIATLVTTTSGDDWTEHQDDSAALFDSSNVGDVIQGGDGLLAVGASPGGEFVPTAAVFTSPDGLAWRRVTPRGNAAFDDKVMTAVIDTGAGFVAVGGDFFRTGLMTAWTSSDGIEWAQAPHPNESTDPSVAYMTAESITIWEDTIWAAGVDFDARRDEGEGRFALWASSDGRDWIRIADVAEIVPFTILDTAGLRLATWPPPTIASRDPVLLFAGE